MCDARCNKERYDSRRQKKPRVDIAAFTSKDNQFEWNQAIHCCDDMSKTLLSFQNKKFKNNEPVVKLSSSKDLTNVTMLDIDICNEFLNTSSDSNSSAEQSITHTHNNAELSNKTTS